MNSWQQPNGNESGGATWHPIEDPGTGNFASKTTWSGTDDFSSHGWEVDFSSVVPKGTKAIMATIYQTNYDAEYYWRAYNDTNISNTPSANSEDSHFLRHNNDRVYDKVFFLNEETVEFTVSNTSIDLYIYYPIAYLL